MVAIIASVKSNEKKLSLEVSLVSSPETKAPGIKNPIPTPKIFITESTVVAMTLFKIIIVT